MGKLVYERFILYKGKKIKKNITYTIKLEHRFSIAVRFCVFHFSTT